MNRFLTMTAVIVLFPVAFGHTQRTVAPSQKPVNDEFRPAPEMQRLFDAFVGSWTVSETFEASIEGGKTRQGRASFRPGPGYSLIEDYRSSGSAGNLNALALVWWDQSAQIYRLLMCANNDGCRQRGTLRWEGKVLVNSWDEYVDGKAATFKDSFVDISASSFRLISEGAANGKTIWRVVTNYKRIAEANQ